MQKGYRAAGLAVTALASLALAIAAVGCGGSSSSSAPPAPLERIAPDASEQGPLPITNSEFYKFPAACDNAVLPCGTSPDSTKFVELWAQVYRPATLDHPPYPVIILLHGNHGTCGRPATDADKTKLGVPLDVNFHIDEDIDYTFTGTCPAGSSVVNNHLGYAYLANRLASQGYVVVSINSNRGITGVDAILGGDFLLIYARGRLVLRHLALLAQWNQGDTSQTPPNPEGSGLPGTLKGKLDFTNVGLFGHSRGGEGVRAAYVLYRDGDPGPFAPNWAALIPGMRIAGVFEVGPTDVNDLGFSGPPLAPQGPLNPQGTAWTVLLPMCDGDVDDLQGVRAFDRVMEQQGNLAELAAPTQKSTYTAWGTNHNFYNTEWQVTDSIGCVGEGNTALFPIAPGSDRAQAIGLSSMLAFVRGNFKTTAAARAYDPIFNRNFNPLFAIPKTVIGPALESIDFPTRVDRGYSPSPSTRISRIVDDFDEATGISSYGIPDDMNGISITNVNGGPIDDPFKCPVPLAPLQIIPNHDPTQRAGSLSWTHGGEDVFLQVNWTAQGEPGEDLTELPGIGAAKALEFRVSRRPVIPLPKVSKAGCSQPPPTQGDPLNATEKTDFSIAIAGADGSATSPVEVRDYLPGAELSGPVGTLGSFDETAKQQVPNPQIHPILQTVRIPLSDFGKLRRVLHQARGVRFIFDKDESGAIYLANVRFANTYGPGVPKVLRGMAAARAPEQSHATIAQAQPQAGAVTHSATIASISRVASSSMLAGAGGVEIDFNSDTIFPVRDQFPRLLIGGTPFYMSGRRSGDLHSIYFVIDNASFAALPDGEPVTIQYGMHGGESWDAGNLDKSMLPSN
ncbi:MAG TPA: hypothetical protein VMH37_16645 [Candidatus Binataceae bacterium]|nr:hypothetical protein [Candidatus Binataceae bacterium]